MESLEVLKSQFWFQSDRIIQHSLHVLSCREGKVVKMSTSSLLLIYNFIYLNFKYELLSLFTQVIKIRGPVYTVCIFMKFAV